MNADAIEKLTTSVVTNISSKREWFWYIDGGTWLDPGESYTIQGDILTVPLHTSRYNKKFAIGRFDTINTFVEDVKNGRLRIVRNETVLMVDESNKSQSYVLGVDEGVLVISTTEDAVKKMYWGFSTQTPPSADILQKLQNSQVFNDRKQALTLYSTERANLYIAYPKEWGEVPNNMFRVSGFPCNAFLKFEVSDTDGTHYYAYCTDSQTLCKQGVSITVQ